MFYVAYALSWVTSRIAGRIRSEKGQDLLEYALLGGLIASAIIAVAVLGVLTGAITDMANAIGDCISWSDDCNLPSFLGSGEGNGNGE